MSSEPFVRASGLGKCYRLHDTPLQGLLGRLGMKGRGQDHWALRDVALELRRGDCVGIVGRNGAGKSTLLELICGVLQPTTGTVETQGRIAALLQLGAGFNPDFTGRENAWLGAALQGIAADEIERRMPAIEAFAGIGAAIDRPVREYSSGMFARLAFSVCAHVDADILVVDEILGVGDVRFQQQSMRFLRAFRRDGIVLFVSHNEHAVSALCNRAVLIDRGRVVEDGPAGDVLYRYRRELSRLLAPERDFAVSGEKVLPAGEKPGEAAPHEAHPFDPDDFGKPQGGAAIDDVGLSLAGGGLVGGLCGGEELALRVSARARRPLSDARILFAVRNPMGQVVFGGDSRDAGLGGQGGLAPADRLDVTFRFSLPYLPTGSYPVELFLVASEAGESRCQDHHDAAQVLKVASRHVSSGMANLAMRRVAISVSDKAA